MPDRLRLGLIFGGRSVEHEVSVVSAQHVVAAADPERFEIVPIGVSKSGTWLTPEESIAQLARDDPPFKKTLIDSSRREANFALQMLTEAALEGTGFKAQQAGQRSRSVGLGRVLEPLQSVDVVFPLVHGTHGEDGTLQGMLELLDLPYVGCGVGASALGMDKALMKTMFIGAGIPVADHLVFDASSSETDALQIAREVEERIGYPAFVKPANGGSSVGISKVRGREELTSGILVASGHDRKLVIEKGIDGVEVECAILGNRDAKASPVGMIRYKRDFYDYEAKYLDPETEIIAPADLPAETVERVQRLALYAFQSIDGAGMSRVDFFLLADGSLIIDEINTIPGFTPASMFPRLWQAAGVSYSELIARLVELALERHREKRIA